MSEKIRPLHNGVCVERIQKDDEKTESGLYIPGTAVKEKPQIGKVIAVGPGKVTPEGRVVPMQVKVGDKVFFGKYAGTEAGDLLIIKEDEILAVVEE